MNIEKVTLKQLRKFNNSIRGDLSKKDINDTKQASRSLVEKKKSDKLYVSIGVDYLEILNRGRRPGKYVPHDVLEAWVERKLGITDEDERKSATFAINQKIKKEGTNIHQDRSKGVQVEKKIKVLRRDLVKALPAAAKFEALQVLNKFTKQFQAENK